METDAPAVQVVTMHAAKGLEFNLVWCPYLWWGSGLGKRDKHQLEFHDAQGRAALDLGSSQLEDHLAAVHQERRAEDLRLAYVALTRARHRLVVYWGPATFEPALAWVLHQPPDQAPSGWSSVFRRLRSDTSIEADLQRLAEHDDLEMSRVDWATGPTADDPAPPERLPLSVRVLSRPRGPQRGWRRASYSTLKRGGLPAPGGPPSADHDEATEIGEEEGGDGLVPLAEMRGGTKVGHMLHAVFEHLDFQEPQTLAAAVKVQLHRYGLPADLSDPLVPAMEAVLRTPLQDGFCLADLPRGQRLDELAFTFPVRGGYQGGQGALTAGALAKAIGAELPSHAPALGALPFPPLRGFLTGAIDLVFRHDGRWYLADYKSNFLGRRWSDYTPARLDHAMVHHHYGLQAHLYTVALHRYLSLRVPNYRYDEHFGGCLYLFLRGMAPEHPGHGVWFHRPSPTTLAALERALGAP
jgi:exodeoxyribonuclease V beta subunit